MKFAKSILTGTGAVVLAGLILALLAPKAAHAIAATAVQVVNTTGSPVPNKSVDEPARNYYSITCVYNPLVSPGAPVCGFPGVNPFSPAISANSIFVPQQLVLWSNSISGTCSQLFLNYTDPTGASIEAGIPYNSTNSNPTGINCTMTQSLNGYYMDANAAPTAGLIGSGITVGNVFRVTLMGYLLPKP